VFPVRYDLDFYIPEDAILHSHCRENLKQSQVYARETNFHYLCQVMAVRSVRFACGISLFAFYSCMLESYAQASENNVRVNTQRLEERITLVQPYRVDLNCAICRTEEITDIRCQRRIWQSA
jgi:hypothetical protein